jgi:hypothetical protein
MHVADDQSQLLSLRSEWIGESQMRIRTRWVGKKKKIVVDVWELTTDRHRTSMARARKVAREAAIRARADTTEYCLLLDQEIHRKATRFTGEKVLVKVRQTSFAF